MLTRRRLLAGTAAAAALTGLAACTDGSEPPNPPAPTEATLFDPVNWASLRSQFQLDFGQAQLAAFLFASHPASVRAAIDRHRAGLDRDPTRYVAVNELAQDDRVLASAATYLTTKAEQIALTDSTTMGLGLLYTGLRLAPGDEVLTTTHDFYSTVESLRLRAVRDGATVRRVTLYDDPAQASGPTIVARLRAGITARTRIVAVTWVHSGTGVKLPIAELAGVVATANRGRPVGQRALLCVDGVHGFGAEADSPDQLGCDFLVSGAHKWLFGPRGTGFVWGRPEAWDRYTPVIPSFTVIDPATSGPGRAASPGGYHSFEHRWALAEAFDLHSVLTAARIQTRTHELAARLKAGLSTIDKLQLVTPASPDLSAGLICCQLPGRSAPDLVSALRERKVIASVTPYAQQYLRFGTTVLANESDVDAAVAALRTMV